MPHSWEDKWTLGRRLGKGGQGIAHEAIAVRDQSVRGALKWLKNNQIVQARRRMRREVVALETLVDCRSVPRVLDHNTGAYADGATELYVVMELIDGKTLHEHIDNSGPLSIDDAVRFVLSLCDTVKIGHSSGILHRDLKPENIIVRGTDPADLVIVDYGLSFNATDEDITHTEEMFRNAFIALPETNTPGSDRRDHRSDLTALSAILFFCLTQESVGQLQDGSGQLPHLREGCRLRTLLKNDVRRQQIEDFLTRGLSPRLANRFQSISEITERLNSIGGAARDFDESDPVQLAQALSAKVRLHDRKTQLAGLTKEAQQLFQYINTEVENYKRQKLDQFVLYLTPGINHPQYKLPNGLDLVAMHSNTLAVRLKEHQYRRNRNYVVAARGTESVIIAVDFSLDATPVGFGSFTNSTIQAAKQKPEITEIASYDTEVQPVLSIVAADLRQWFTKAMKYLTKHIAPEQAE